MESGIETKDTKVDYLADIWEADPGYCELIGRISGDVAHIGKDSDYANCAPLLPFLSISTLDGGKKIIVHNSHEVLVPVKERKSLIEKLYSTH